MAKTVFEVVEEYLMINCINYRRQAKKNKGNSFTFIDGTSYVIAN